MKEIIVSIYFTDQGKAYLYSDDDESAKILNDDLMTKAVELELSGEMVEMPEFSAGNIAFLCDFYKVVFVR